MPANKKTIAGMARSYNFNCGIQVYGTARVPPSPQGQVSPVG